jgi:hypothetical protein
VAEQGQNVDAETIELATVKTSGVALLGGIVLVLALANNFERSCYSTKSNDHE